MSDRLEGWVNMVKARIRDHWDYVIVVDGREGSGKSTLALHIKALYDGSYNLNHVLFDAESLLEEMEKAPMGSCVMLDEAIISLYKRDSLKEFQTILVKSFSIIRARELFFIMVLPNFWDLDGSLRNRANYRVYVYAKGGYRGYSQFYKVKRTQWSTNWAWQDLEWEYTFPTLPSRFEPIYDKFKTVSLKKALGKFKKDIEVEQQKVKDKREGLRGQKLRMCKEYLGKHPQATAVEVAGECSVSLGYAKESVQVYGKTDKEQNE